MPKKPAKGGSVLNAMKYLARVSSMIRSQDGGLADNPYKRRFFHLLHATPTTTKYKTEKTERGMSSKITSNAAVSDQHFLNLLVAVGCVFGMHLLNPNEVLMIDPKVVRPPLGTELKNAFMPANQNYPRKRPLACPSSLDLRPNVTGQRRQRIHTHGSNRHSLACAHFQLLTPVRSCPVLFATIRA